MFEAAGILSPAVGSLFYTYDGPGKPREAAPSARLGINSTKTTHPSLTMKLANIFAKPRWGFPGLFIYLFIYLLLKYHTVDVGRFSASLYW